MCHSVTKMVMLCPPTYRRGWSIQTVASFEVSHFTLWNYIYADVRNSDDV